MSLLSLTNRGWIQVGSFLASGLLIMLFAAALRGEFQPGTGATWGPRAVGMTGFGLVVAGIFPPDPSYGYPPGAPAGIGANVSTAAYLHLAGALVFFVGLIAAPVVLSRRFARTGQSGWAAVSILTAATVLGFWGASSGGPNGLPLVPPVAGLLQRVAIIVGLGWLAALAFVLLAGETGKSRASADR